MLINRVVVQGFKTFANKTEFHFDPGVTALVGPNGSGKSNVVDAVRWCLGEQSFSTLRSKKTSDIIFAGSDKKARLSMAQVSLLLDNSAGEIPIDFTEVEITRRAYRDGGNEYLLNGRKVRLQDITELLGPTGLGRRAYAVVGQGLIDKVLHLSPEERRTFFEEAAGITGYQSKRSATLRRLDATQKNLERVQDIITEINPRLRSLKRQADQAIKRTEIADELHSLLLEWYGYRWYRVGQELVHHQHSEEQLRQQITTQQQRLTELGAKIEALRAQQSEERGQLTELHSESSKLHGEAEAIGRELAVAQERLHQLRERQEDAQRELVPLRLQQTTLEERQVDLQTTLQEATSALQAREEAVNGLQLTLLQRQQERSLLQERLDTARRQLNEVQNHQTDHKSRLTQAGERRITLTQELENFARAQSVADQESAEAQQALAEAEAEVTHSVKLVSAIQADMAQRQETIQQLTQQLNGAEQERQSADRALDRLQTRLELLRRLQAEGAGYASGVRTILQASRGTSSGQKLAGILGTVATLVRVPSELDKAIETALGGAFQNVITESWADAREAIDYLKQSGRGRATFLPLDRLNVLPAIPAPQMNGIMGNAAALIDADPRIDQVVQQLLGRVWVATDLTAARRALDAIGRGSRPTVVTLGGEIVRPGGAVTGGRDSNRRDDSVLARERELRELPQQISTAEQQLQGAVEQCAGLNSDIEREQAYIAARQQQLDDTNHKERQQREQLENLRRRLDRAEQTTQWQRERSTQTETELGKLVEQEGVLEAGLAELIQRLTVAEGALAQAEQAIAAAGVDQLLQQLADLRAAAAEAQGHLRSQQTLRENQARTLQSTLSQIENRQQRVAQLSGEITVLDGEVAQLRIQENALGQKLAALRTRIEPLEAKLAQWTEKQTAQEDIERQQQKQLRVYEQEWNSAQLALQRAQDARDQICNEIEQDFALIEPPLSDSERDDSEGDDSERDDQEVVLEPMVDESLLSEPDEPIRPLWETLVAGLPQVESVAGDLEERVRKTRNRLSRVNNVNPDAPREYEEVAGRHDFLIQQTDDLEAAAADLRSVMEELDELMEGELRRTFDAVRQQFIHFFQLLFSGGTAELVLTDPSNMTTTGVELIARPPGKRVQSLALLSGGERSLSACALIFALLKVSPTPFCVLDEVDAALDEANIDRFRQTVDTLTAEAVAQTEEAGQGTQFIIVTHNRRTLETCNTIYGITMGDNGVSQMISLRLENNELVQGNSADGSTSKAQLDEIAELVQV